MSVSYDSVITGVGIIAPNGIGLEEYWAATLAGVSGIGPTTRFDPATYPVVLAGEVDGFHAGDHLGSRLMPQTDHMTRMALAVSDWALADAAVAPGDLDEYAMSVVTASASGGFEYGQRELENLWRLGPRHVSAYQSFAWFYAVNTGQISIRHGMRGPGGVLVAEQAGGLDVIAQARRNLRRDTELVITGGVDSSLCPWGLVAQLPTGLLSRAIDPVRAYLPFDEEAGGHVPGEGGAILVLERAESARRRSAPRPYGTVAGWGSSFDPAPATGRPSSLSSAIHTALTDAGITASDVDVVFADGAGSPELDRVEAVALEQVFGPRAVPVTAPKSMTGRLYSGGAPVDVVTALLSMRDSIIPFTTGTTQPRDAERIDLVMEVPRETPVRTAVVIARGNGGFNSALVLRAA